MAEPSDVIRRYLDAWLVNDLATVLGSYGDELTLEWPGSHDLAGRHVGADALNALAALQGRTGRRPLDYGAPLHGPYSTIVVVHEEWSFGATTIVVERALQFVVTDSKITHVTVYDADPAAVDAFLAVSATR